MLLEGLVAVTFAMMAGSPALLGFGIDSFVESLSGMVMIWRFSHSAEDEHKERMAIKLVGVSLIVLATYAYEAATTSIIANRQTEASWA